MLVSLIRGTIMYFSVIATVRIMGKRQIGQLQPTELVVTILLSEIAAAPIVDGELPLITSVSTICLLISLEILVSCISLKSPSFRKILQGNSLAVIENGRINYKRMKSLRLSVDDLLEALRLKDVFDISQVELAYIETNGNISVELKPENKAVTVGQMKLSEPHTGIPQLVISDGKIIRESFAGCCLNEGKLEKLLKSRKIKAGDVLILTADKEKVITVILKEEKK